MSKATGLWNAAKEAYRAARGLLSKNERNAATAQAKKERGPVKAMFHITKNENVPAIERQGLVANSPNANVNSAWQPFSSVGVKGGGNWVVDQPTAFPVYGTTVGGKYGNEAARRDALTTFKIEFPVSKLPTTRAVRDPYGNAKLTTADKGWSPFGTWAGDRVNTMAILEDIDPKYLKNIGYVEELNPSKKIVVTQPEIRWEPRETLDPRIYRESRNLSKADRAALSGVTGHDRTTARNFNREPDMAKSPARFVEEYLDKHRPITERLPVIPESDSGFLTAHDWTNLFVPYTPFGQATRGSVEFKPGAISRGMGGQMMPFIKDRNFNWNVYKRLIAEGKAPSIAADYSTPYYVLDWDNIVYHNVRGYGPKVVKPANGNYFRPNIGHISTGTPRGRVVDVVTGELLVNPNTQGAIHQYHQLTPEAIESLKNYTAYDDIVKDKDHPTWQELTRVLMRINAGTSTPYW